MRSARRLLVTLSLFASFAASPGRADPLPRDDARPSPAQQALVDALERADAASTTSADLRLRLLFSIGGLEKRGELWFDHEAIPLETLVEQARGSTDPLILDMLSARCGGDRCDALAMARRWTEADTQNQLAWLRMANILDRRGARDEAREVFVRAARASVWRDPYRAALSLVVRDVPATATSVERAAAIFEGVGKATRLIVFGELALLGRYCKEPGLRESCRRIVETMARDDESMVVQTLLPMYATRAGMPATTVDAYRRTSDALHWAGTLHAADHTGNITDLDSLIAGADAFADIASSGERTRMRRVLAASGLTDEEAAKRYVATLTSQQLARRAAVDR